MVLVFVPFERAVSEGRDRCVLTRPILQSVFLNEAGLPATAALVVVESSALRADSGRVYS
jgi:hypothetical protein